MTKAIIRAERPGYTITLGDDIALASNYAEAQREAREMEERSKVYVIQKDGEYLCNPELGFLPEFCKDKSKAIVYPDRGWAELMIEDIQGATVEVIE